MEARSSSGIARIMERHLEYLLLDRDQLPTDGSTFDFEGAQFLDIEVSFIWVDMPPDGRVRLHRHPYREIFIIQEGRAKFTIGSASLTVHAGQIIIAPADLPHKFENAGDTQLKQVDIHMSRHIITQW